MQVNLWWFSAKVCPTHICITSKLQPNSARSLQIYLLFFSVRCGGPKNSLTATSWLNPMPHWLNTKLLGISLTLFIPDTVVRLSWYKSTNLQQSLGLNWWTHCCLVKSWYVSWFSYVKKTRLAWGACTVTCPPPWLCVLIFLLHILQCELGRMSTLWHELTSSVE